MIHLEFATFCPACFAHVCAEPTDLLHEARIAAHVRGGRPTNLGAVLVEPNALRHFLHVLFGEASIRAMLALLSTLETGLHTALVFLMTHRILQPN